VVVEDRSEPKLAVATEVKFDLVRVEVVSVGVVWKVLVGVGSNCAGADDAAGLNVGVACNALELAAERE
jgi:hypothetical protein